MRNTRLYSFWVRFLQVIDDVMILFRPPMVKAEHIRKAMELAKPGHIICRRFKYYLIAYFIKGKYTHSGFVISDKEMIHAIADGVEHVDIIDYIKNTDGFIILEPPYKSADDIQTIINFKKDAVAQKKPYDYLFDKDDDRAYYCHELVWRAFNSVGMNMPVEGKIVYASDVIKYCKVIYETSF